MSEPTTSLRTPQYEQRFERYVQWEYESLAEPQANISMAKPQFATYANAETPSPQFE